MIPALLALTLSVPSFAADADPHVNGCGPAWITAAKANRIELLGVDFTDACAEHDRCYSACIGKHDTPGCEQDWTAWLRRKARCDKTFLDDMTATCPPPDQPRAWSCRTTATLFHTLVRGGGGITFDGMQVENLYSQVERGEDIAPTLDQLTNLDLEALSGEKLWSLEPQLVQFPPDGSQVTLAAVPTGGLVPYASNLRPLTDAEVAALVTATLDGKTKIKLDAAQLKQLVLDLQRTFTTPSP